LGIKCFCFHVRYRISYAIDRKTTQQKIIQIVKIILYFCSLRIYKKVNKKRRNNSTEIEIQEKKIAGNHPCDSFSFDGLAPKMALTQQTISDYVQHLAFVPCPPLSPVYL